MCHTKDVKRFILVGFALLLFVVGVVKAEEDEVDASKLIRDRYKNEVKNVVKLQEMRKENGEDLKQRLEAMKDERKKLMLQTLNTQMCRLQSQRVSQMNKQLATMEKIAAKLDMKLVRATDAARKATAEKEIKEAREVWTTAKTAVDTFSKRTCELTLSGTEPLYAGQARTARESLIKDILSVHEKIKTARRALSEAVVATAKAMGEEVPAAIRE